MGQFKAYVSADLADVYQNARNKGDFLPNFPIDDMNRDYHQLMLLHKINCYHENAKELQEEGQKLYPSLFSGNNIGLRDYFQMRYCQPAVTTFDKDKKELELIFPIYKTDKYLSCFLPVSKVQEMIEEEIARNMKSLEKFCDKPMHRSNGLRLDLVQDARKANVIMRDCFERITDWIIADPIRDLKPQPYPPQEKENADNTLTLTGFNDGPSMFMHQISEKPFGTDALELAVNTVNKLNCN